jgi:hypothetical protein
MSIHRQLKDSAFCPEDIERLVRAYEVAMRELSTTGPDCPPHELIAATVIEIAQTGERDQTVTAEKTVTRLRK